MPRRKSNDSAAPGAHPRLQGYFAYALFNLERKPPSWHPGHSKQFKTHWLAGYDKAVKDKEERG